jgi:hypothetical protein
LLLLLLAARALARLLLLLPVGLSPFSSSDRAATASVAAFMSASCLDTLDITLAAHTPSLLLPLLLLLLLPASASVCSCADRVSRAPSVEAP